MFNIPYLKTDNEKINEVYRIAVGDFIGNIAPWQGEYNKSEKTCILAGLDYDKPWTRDASINSWFAGSYLVPEIAENTLKSVLTEDHYGLRIGGQYWDAVVWVTAAWNHYLVTGNVEFLKIALVVAENSIRYFEDNEFDKKDNLFRGAAFFQDGIAGYPDKFAENAETSCILDWIFTHSEEKCKTGYGLPMKAHSTNCLYYNAYIIIDKMKLELGYSLDTINEIKADNLRNAINKNFWLKDKKRYKYLVDGFDVADRSEAAGNAFALLFGVNDDLNIFNIAENQPVTLNGVPVVWPNFKRYENAEKAYYGRHVAIWPHVNALWNAALNCKGYREEAFKELELLTEKVYRDCYFAEIYHPDTGEVYGGVQEMLEGGCAEIVEWKSCRRQTWCATGYIQMILSTFLGIEISVQGMNFNPYLNSSVNSLVFKGLKYRNAILNIEIRESNKNQFFVNNEKQDDFFLNKNISGLQNILITRKA